MSYPQRLPAAANAADDLVNISGSAASEDAVASALRERFAKDQPYVRLGSDVIVAVNPCKVLASSQDETCKAYAANAKDTVTERHNLAPHVFEIAKNAYYTMLRNREDQSITLLGESGSGKSETRQLLVRQLVALAKSEKKKTKIHSGSVKLEHVLEAFGNAKTQSNPNSSRFGQYAEYQFDKDGKMIGVKILDYLLEKTRVTKVPADERNFHAFYYLLAGASAEEKAQWYLSDPSAFAYLSQSKHHRNLTTEDALKFAELKDYLKSLGVGRRQQAQIFQLLAAILHLGNVQFFDDPNNPHDACQIRNLDVLDMVANFIGVDSKSLESVLTYKTKLIKKELCTILLNAEGAAEQRDSLAQTLYSLLFAWIVEHLNNRLCKDDCTNFISIIDFPGASVGSSTSGANKAGFETLLYNFVNERLFAHSTKCLIDDMEAIYRSEGLQFPKMTSNDNRGVIDILSNSQNGILQTLDAESLKGRTRNPDGKFTEKVYENHSSSTTFIASKKPNYAFGIRHYNAEIEYDTHGFIDRNLDTLSIDFVTLFRGADGMAPTANIFIRGLFSDKIVNTQKHQQNDKVIVAAQHSSKPSRHPSMRRKRSSGDNKPALETVAGQVLSAMDELFETLTETRSWFIYNIKPCEDVTSGGRWDNKRVCAQLKSLDIVSLLQRFKVAPYSYHYTFEEFAGKFGPMLQSLRLDTTASRQCVEAFIDGGSYPASDIVVAKNRVFFSSPMWFAMNDEMRGLELETLASLSGAKRGSRDTLVTDKSSIRSGHSGYQSDYNSQYMSENESDYFDDGASYISDTESHYDSEYRFDMNGTAAKDIETGNGVGKFTPVGSDGKFVDMPVEETKKKLTPARKKWLCCTWCLTWWVPTFCISCCGMKRPDIQMAWREKVALCIIIAFICALLLFFIAGLGRIICPKQDVKSPSELEFKDIDDPYVWMYGRYYKINGIIKSHLNVYVDFPSYFDDEKAGVLGTDVSDMFYKTGSSALFKKYCPNLPVPNGGAWDNIVSRGDSVLNNFRYRHSQNKDYFGNLNKYAEGKVAWRVADVERAPTTSDPRTMVIMYDNVYDFTQYPLADPQFLGPTFSSLISLRKGQDISSQFDQFIRDKDPLWRDYLTCINNLFYVGTVDRRNDFRCVFSNIMLLVASIIIVAVIGFKFLAALQLTSRREPEEHDKFVVCQVPCYTEGPESLTKTLESLAMLRYDDKRKLLFIIADGMIIGSGNDRPTPRIVLDILGFDPSLDPEPLSFVSIGEGNKQHNMGKVYSGLYEVQGHAVPFLVIVKVGKPSERSRPGNRGKRDSQMILMRFLSKVHFNQEMNPLELELYHQMKNVIGVSPSFYEYALMVDADTEVYTDSLNRMISFMVHDSKVMGLCGETLLSNEKDSWVTMIQVYEYFISHHLAKAFESLFGSVTCLPGCFCMYRVRTPTKNIPLLVAPSLITDYSENVVDTLHMKNLLSLGEDRYLTTLMLKHFPHMKLSFTPDAQCRTNAPDRWSVLLSQRRRWINSTVHNLWELLSLAQLCGFCCFSMRFVVFLDLFATVVQPAAVLYIVYLIYTLIFEDTVFPLISIVLIAAIYGLQVIIFILKRQWQHIGWMIIYILAIPVFSFYIPVYSFWHFDDFSWGNTRVVAGGAGGVKYVAETEPFDPSAIPLKKWSDYEAELWEKQSVVSRESRVSGLSAGSHLSRYSAGALPQYQNGSVYGGNSSAMYGSVTPAVPMYTPPARPSSMYGGNRPVSMSASNITGPTDYTGYTTSYAGMPASSAIGSNVTVMPSDEEILNEVRHILSTADLMTVTKKQVRDELSRFFGLDLSDKKDYINQCIDGILQGRI